VARHLFPHRRARRTATALLVLGVAALGATGAHAASATAAATPKVARAHCAPGWTITAHKQGFVCRRGATFRHPLCGSGTTLFSAPGGWLCAELPDLKAPPPPSLLPPANG